MTKRKRKRKTLELQLPLEEGVTYLFEDETIAKAYEIFVNFLSEGGTGLCITRTYPPRVLKQYNLGNIPIIWLTKQKSDENLDPVQLSLISHTIQQFISKEEGSMVILDGVEYLITQNEFKPVLRFIQHIRDEVFTQKANLLIPLSPNALATAEVKLLERDLELYHDDSHEKG